MKTPRKPTTRLKKQFSSALLQLFKSDDYKPMSKKEVVRRFSVEDDHFPLFDEVLKEFIDKKIILFKRGRYEYPTKKKKIPAIIGKISIHNKGFGFVNVIEPKEFGPDIFIAPPFIHGAVEGDTVEVKLIEKKTPSPKGPEGEILKVIKRRQNRLVGTVYKVLPKKGALAIAAALGSSKIVLVKKSTERKFVVGDRLLLGVDKWPKERGEDIECKFLSYLGSINDPSIDHVVAAREYDIPTHFSSKVKKEAKSFGTTVKPKEIKNRKNYTKLETITIDPKTAKDYDDALSLEIDKEGRFHLYVHIADVSHYVRPDSELDKEALIRGNTTYFPGFAFPMIPEELSNELCSLKEGVLRLTVTVRMIFDKEGLLLEHHFEKSAIKSQKRFSYEEAKEVLDHKRPSKYYDILKRLEKLYYFLKKHKYERGSVDLSTDDTILKVDSNGTPTSVEVVQYDITHKIIEECMLKANELVAKELRERGTPAIFRVHEKPDRENLREFYRYARSLHFALPEEPSMEDIQQIFTEIEGSSVQKRLTTSYIRSMKLALYSDDPIGHYGLALTDYTHFTSPIRRYIDLIVHRQLFDPDYRPDVKFIATNCSETERKSFKAEMSVSNLKKLRYLKTLYEARPRDEYAATLTKIKQQGVFFDLDFLGFEGFIHISSFHREFFHYFEETSIFVGEESNQKLYVGMPIKIKIDEIDLIFQECRWKIVSY